MRTTTLMRSQNVTRRTAFAAATGLLAVGLAACSGAGSGDETTAADGGTTSSAASDGGGAGGTTASDNGGSSSATDAGGSSNRETFTAMPGREIDLRTQQFPITPEQAVEKATSEVGSGGTLHAIELDHSSSANAWEWEVKILADGTDHKVEINAMTGDINRHEQDKTNDQEKPIDLSSPMGFDEAMKLATDKLDGPVREWKLEYDDGRVAYQFDIGQDGGGTEEVTVDVNSKQVTIDG